MSTHLAKIILDNASIKCLYKGFKVEDGIGFNHYTVKVFFRGMNRSFPYFQGEGLKGSPSLSNILEILIQDYQIDSVETLIYYLGYSLEEATQCFKGIQKNKEKLNELFTKEQLESLSEYYLGGLRRD